jgi:hypothetical protein
VIAKSITGQLAIFGRLGHGRLLDWRAVRVLGTASHVHLTPAI